MNGPISEDMLHAFIDGELPAASREPLERAMLHDPDMAQRIALYRADKTQTEQMFAPLLEAPVPLAWIDMIKHPTGKARRAWRTDWRAMAAMAATLVLLAVVSVSVYRGSRPGDEPIIREALEARAGEYRPAQRVHVSSTREAGLVMVSALSMPVKAPDLSRLGYRLTDLNVYSGTQSGNAVELRYRKTDGRGFALYVRRSSDAPRFDQFERAGLRVCIWQDEVLGTVMSGTMSAAEMQRLAALAYSGLEA